jgi:hypothetical protein
MLPNRRNSVLAAGVLVVVLLGGGLSAQDLEQMKLFAPADLSTYGSGPKPRQGYFFVFDGLSWSISRPDTKPTGFPGLSRQVWHNSVTSEIQTSTHNTGLLNSEFTEGNRIEFGRVYGRHGWLFSSYRLNHQVQSSFSNDVDIVFSDPNGLLRGIVGDMLGYDGNTAMYGNYFFADLPISFDELLMENRVETWGVELMYLYRSRQIHRGGFFEFLAGMRYLEFDDTFEVIARGTERVNRNGNPVDGIANERFVFDLGPDGSPTNTNWNPIGPGNVLANSNWTTEAENHIIGPQIGGRWFRKDGRWTLSAEGRFFAGLNMQNVRQYGLLGSELNAPQPYNFGFPRPPGVGSNYPYVPLLREPYHFDHKVSLPVWSPGGELRLDLMFQVTDAVSFEVGWTGLWLGGIARASAMPNYVISNGGTMEINRGENRQDVFINGLNVGLKINR